MPLENAKLYFEASVDDDRPTAVSTDDPLPVSLAAPVASEGYTPSSVLVASGQVATSAGVLHSLTFSQNDAAPTAGSVAVYDGIGATGTVLYRETFDTTIFRAYSVILDVKFSVGLYIAWTTTADVNVVASYR